MKKNWSIVLAMCLILSLIVTGCSATAKPAAAPTTPAVTSSPAASDIYAGVPKGKWIVGYTNGMTGNAWRAQNVAAWEEECTAMKKAGLIAEYYTANVDGDDAQIAAISDMIAKGCDMITGQFSAPAYNSVVTEALNKGIIVVAAGDCGLKVTPDQPYIQNQHFIMLNAENDEYMRAPMEYLCYQMGYKGQLVHLYGLEGGWPGGEVRKAAVRQVAAKYNMPIVAGAPCTWLNSTANQTMTSLLSAHTDYSGKSTLVAAEDVGLGVMQAYEAAKLPFPYLIGDYTYGFLREWGKYPDLVACGNVYPPSISRATLYVGVLALNGYKLDPAKSTVDGVPDNLICPMPFIIINQTQITGSEPWLKNIKSTTHVKLLKDLLAEGVAKGYSDAQCADGWPSVQELLNLYYVKK